MFGYRKFSWVLKTATPPPQQAPVHPWQVEGGKWHAHARPGDPNSPIIEVAAPAAGESEGASQQAEPENKSANLRMNQRQEISEAFVDIASNFGEFLETGKADRRTGTPRNVVDLSDIGGTEANNQISAWLSQLRNRPGNYRTRLNPGQRERLAFAMMTHVADSLENWDKHGGKHADKDTAAKQIGRWLSKLPGNMWDRRIPHPSSGA